MRCVFATCVVAVAFFLSSSLVAGDEKAEVESAAKELKSKDVKVRLAAVGKLAELGEAAGRPLCEAMMDKDKKVATAALVALEKAHPALYRPVSKMVLSKSEVDELKGVEELDDLGADAQVAMPLLIARFNSGLARAKQKVPFAPSFGVLDGYYKIIAKGDKESAAVLAVIKATATPDSDFRFRSLEWLFAWADKKEERRKEILPFVREGLAKRPNSIAYIRAAGDLGPVAKELLPTLRKLKLSDSEMIREAATIAVSEIDRKEP